MDIADVAKKRRELETKILPLIQEFESETQASVFALDLGRADSSHMGGPRESIITRFRIRIEL